MEEFVGYLENGNYQKASNFLSVRADELDDSVLEQIQRFGVDQCGEEFFRDFVNKIPLLRFDHPSSYLRPEWYAWRSQSLKCSTELLKRGLRIRLKDFYLLNKSKFGWRYASIFILILLLLTKSAKSPPIRQFIFTKFHQRTNHFRHVSNSIIYHHNKRYQQEIE